MSPQNLTNVYNQNPTLQGQYSLQQYLDLFGGSTYTPPTTTPTPTPTPTPPSQGIINSGINQYQSGDNDGNDITGFGAFGNLDKSTAKTEYKDVSDGKGGSYIKEFTTYMDPGGLRKTFDGKNVTHGDATTLGGMIMDGITGNKKTNELGYKTAGDTFGTFSKRPDLTNAYGIPYADLNLLGKIKTKFNRNQELKNLGKLAVEQKKLEERIKKEAAEEKSKQIAANRIQAANEQNRTGGYQAGYGVILWVVVVEVQVWGPLTKGVRIVWVHLQEVVE